MAEWLVREQAGAEAGVRLQGRLARVLEGDGRLLQGPLARARRRGLRRGHLRRRPRPRPLVAGHAPARRGRGLRLHLRRLVAAVRLPADPRDSRCRHGHLDRHERVGERHARDRGGRERLELPGARLRLPADLLRGHADRVGRPDRRGVRGRVRRAARQPLRAARLRARRRGRRRDRGGRLDRRRRRSPRRCSAVRVQIDYFGTPMAFTDDLPPASAGGLLGRGVPERRQHADRHGRRPVRFPTSATAARARERRRPPGRRKENAPTTRHDER